VATISFAGDYGANLLQNAGTRDHHDSTYTGGSDADHSPTLPAATVATISFTRPTTARNLLQNAGTVTGTITFTGGSDADQLTTSPAVRRQPISFTGDDGANLLQNAGTVTGTITFTVGSDADQLATFVGSLSASTITFHRRTTGANLLSERRKR